MKGLWTRRSEFFRQHRVLVVGGATMLALLLFFLLVELANVDAEALGAVASAIAAVFAAVAAVESRGVARDASRAIGLATKPELMALLEPGGTMWSDSKDQVFTLVVENYSQNPAVHVEVEVTLRDGSTWSERFGRIDGRDRPHPGNFLPDKSPAETIDLGPHDASLAGTDRVVLRFSDEARTVRWERVREWRYEREVDEATGQVSHPRRQRPQPPDREIALV